MLSKFYLSRQQSRAWSIDNPVGDPFGGVAYGEFNDPSTIIGTVAGPIVGGIIGGDASQSAANTQAQSGQSAIGEQQREFDINQANLAPYEQFGQSALGTLGNYLGIPGYSTNDANSGSLLKPFSYDQSTDPGYQAGLTSGFQGINNAAATGAGSGLLSGATLKELLSYGQNYAGTAYQNAFNRDQSTKNQNYSMLTGAEGIGQGATNTGVSAGTSQANSIANTITGIGNAQAAGQVGQANAISGGISSGINNYQNNLLLSSIAKNNGQQGSIFNSAYTDPNSSNFSNNPIPDNLS